MIAPLTFVSRGCAELFSYGDVASQFPHVDSLEDIRAGLEHALGQPSAGPRPLDLCGHSRGRTKLLVMGQDTIDPYIPRIATFFGDLAADRILPRLEINALRLLGCSTASSPLAARTLRWLANVLQLPVYGTRKMLMNAHYGANGFSSIFESLLLESDETSHWKEPR